MGNFGQTIKRFISNKNTVTILAVLVGVVLLWYFYNYRVEQAITTIRVPYAISRIDSGKKIEADNIDYKFVTKSATDKSSIITDVNFLNGKYICVGSSVPQDGFFYQSQICEQSELKNSVFDDLPDGYTIYNLAVDSQSTYANSIIPGSYIDLYLRATDDNGQVIYGKLIESIEVLRVRDSSGRDLFWDSTAGNSAWLLFAVPDDYNKLLVTSESVTGYNIKILPVPRNRSYTQNPGETSISSDDLYNFIMRNSASIGN